MLVTRSTSELVMPFTTALTDFWIHLRLHQEDVEALDSYIVIMNSDQTTPAYRIDMGASGNWSARRYKTAAWSASLVTSANPVVVNTAADIDIHIVRHLTTGSIDIYKDNVSVLSYSGDTDTDVTPELVKFSGLTTNAREMSISQVIVANEDTKGMKIATNSVDGDGTTGDWTGDYTAVDEFIYDNADYDETNSTSQVELRTVSDINAAYSTYNVKAVMVSDIISNDAGSAVTDAQHQLRTGGTTYSGANLSITKDGTDQSVTTVWETNPNTAASWSQAEVNALECGTKSV